MDIYTYIIKYINMGDKKRRSCHPRTKQDINFIPDMRMMKIQKKYKKRI